ncbi:HK97 family phage prohead protease [Rhodococcus sp. LB1]|uniref:HK97 family phage prohead protease n=1 Tax=Rhodococcus sp. LB1 TaxID=1807499 RepID=UPI0007C6BE66|nr:HK97 family phage prohead protease [Rhodococcus sp. LB1]
MSEILFRSTELRAADTGRTVFGTVVPYGPTAEIHELGRSYRERFAPGAFQRSIAERGDKVRLLVSHDRGKLPIGKAVDLFEQSDGLHASFAIAGTRDGDDALALVRSGVVDSFSIGFRPIRDRQDNGVTVRTECALMECSLVGFPAYEGATVAGVRTADPQQIEALWQAEQMRQHHNRLSVSCAERRLDLLLRSAWPHLAVRADDPKKPYCDVEYADPGYQEDGKKRYPLDSEDHVKAAWSYINQEKNAAKYDSKDLARIKARIRAAAKKFGIELKDDESK